MAMIRMLAVQEGNDFSARGNLIHVSSCNPATFVSCVADTTYDPPSDGFHRFGTSSNERKTRYRQCGESSKSHENYPIPNVDTVRKAHRSTFSKAQGVRDGNKHYFRAIQRIRNDNVTSRMTSSLVSTSRQQSTDSLVFWRKSHDRKPFNLQRPVLHTCLPTTEIVHVRYMRLVSWT